MARRPRIFQMAYAPWWLSASTGVVLLVFGWLVLPLILSGSPLVRTTLPGIQLATYIIAGLSFLAATFSLGRHVLQGRLFRFVQTGRHLSSLDWREFEQLLAAAFRQQGYQVLDNPPGPDGGVDLRLCGNGRQVYVQSKHWRNRRVGVRTVRELAGIVKTAGVDKGILVSSIGFTDEARQFASKADIELIGVRQLRNWLGEAAAAFPSLPPEHSEVPECPLCGLPMVRRIARRGPLAGSEFFGCRDYPACKQTRPLEPQALQRPMRCATPYLRRDSAE